MSNKNNDKEQVNRKFEEDINKEGKDKHKVQHLKQGSEIQWKARKRPEYMNKLTRLVSGGFHYGGFDKDGNNSYRK